MAYGKILVDQVENSDGKSLNVGPGARVFDTVTDLQASTTLSDGDIVIVKERANAEYEIQSSAYTALEGDLTLNSGQVAELQLKAINDVRWWGVVDDYDYDTKTGTDNATALQSAISRGDGYKQHVLGNGGSGAIGISSTVKIDRGHISIVNGMQICAITGWSVGTIDLDNMNGDAATARTNRGNSLLRAWYEDCTITYDSVRDYSNIDVDVNLYGANEAPGVSFEYCRRGKHKITALGCSYYGVAYLTKNEGTTVSAKVEEWEWGSDGYNDTSYRTARNFVVMCADIFVVDLISNYCLWPLYIKDSYHTQYGQVHVFNGDDAAGDEALQGIYIESSAWPLISSLYLDGVQIHSYTTYINIGNIMWIWESSADLPMMYLYATEANQTFSNLTIGGVTSTQNGRRMIEVVDDETNGYSFTKSKACNVGYLSTSNTLGPILGNLVNGKKIKVTPTWTATGSIYEYEFDFNDYLLLPEAVYSASFRVSHYVRDSTYTPVADTGNINTSYMLDIVNKTITFYSTSNRNNQFFDLCIDEAVY